MSQESKPQGDKAELLNKLRIDSDDDEGNSRHPVILAICVALVLLVGGLVLFFAVSGDESSAERKATPSSEQRAQKSTESLVAAPPNTPLSAVTSDIGSEILNASGYVVARVRATVSAEILGRIDTVLVEEGMFVEQGQVLAEIDSTIAKVDWQLTKARVQASERRLIATKAERLEAARVLERLKALDEKRFTSEAEISRAQATLDAVSAELSALEAELNVTRLSERRQSELLDKHILRAPFSGVVTVKNAQPGEIISPSSAGGGFTRTGICTVVDMNSLEIEVDVNESYIGRVFQNQKVVAVLDAYPNWEIPAKVIAVIPTADRAKATVKVRIGLMLRDTKILPEMGVKVSFFNDAINEDDNNE